MSQYQISHFYHFTPWADYERHRAAILDTCQKLGLKGSILIAEEGMNGALCGDAPKVEEGVAYLRSLPGFAAMEVRSYGVDAIPFKRMKVRLKKEIVTMGASYPSMGGHYAAVDAWDELLQSGDVRIIDTRNDYEYEMGHFEGALNPNTKDFGEFPEWVEQHLAGDKETPLAIYCTGGIRCEKAGKYLAEQGFKNVVQLHGGIIDYLHQSKNARGLWRGDCFVFDDRVALDAGLNAVGTICPHCHEAHRTDAPHECR
jgi:UPF0176 protein